MENENTIPFYKKVGYSIGKISKYPEMINLGWKKAVKYLVILMIIFAAILSGISTYSSYQYAQETYKYLQENIPECEYKEGVLTTNNEEAKTLENTFLTNSFGGKIIIDTKTEDENAINGYISSLGSDIGYILRKDKIITVNLENDGNKAYTYPEFFEKYFKTKIDSFTKQDILNIVQIEGNRYITFYLEYLIIYAISYFIVFSIYIFIATLIIFIFAKILKIKYKLPDIYASTIYGFTLTIILYLAYIIISYFTQIVVPYLEQILVVIGTLYSTVAVYKEKENQTISE